MVTVLIDRRTVADIAEEFRLPLKTEGRRVSVEIALGGGKVEFYGMVPIISNPHQSTSDMMAELGARVFHT